jgi:hypothetical protein
MPNLSRRHGLALLAAALLGNAAQAETVIGSGRMVNENRAVAAFEAVTLEGSFTVKVSQGSREALELRADDNLLPLIETEVESRSGRPTLVLRWKRSTSVRNSGDIVISVEARTLRALSAAGSGMIEAEAIEGDRLALAVAGSGDLRVGRVVLNELQASVAGSGDIRAGGSAAAVKLSIAGSGDVDLAGVEAEQVKVSIAGSGDASVTAHQSLSVSIAGSGDVRYGGRVQTVKRSIVGSGDVQRR